MVEKLKAAGNTRPKEVMCDASMLHALLLVKSCNIGCIIYPLASRAKSSACLLPTATGGQFSPCFIRIFWLLAFGKNGCVQLGDVFFLNSTPLSAFSVCWPPSKRGRSPPILLQYLTFCAPQVFRQWSGRAAYLRPYSWIVRGPTTTKGKRTSQGIRCL